MNKKRRSLLILLASWVFAPTLFSQDLDRRSTIIIEQQSNKFRATLLMARKHLPEVAVGEGVEVSDSYTIANYFQETIAKTSLSLGGKNCEWSTPSGNLSAHAIYLQVLAFCMNESPSSHIVWELDFLKALPANHPVMVNMLAKENVEQFVLGRENYVVSYHPTPVNVAFSNGLSFIGINPMGWVDSYGEIALPLGIWILFFSLYLNLSERTLAQARKIAVAYCLFLSLSLLASFLWQWWFSEARATAVVLMSMLLYFVAQWFTKPFAVRVLMVAIVGTVHGTAGLSLLPNLPKYFGTTSLFAAFQVGAILGIWVGLLMLIPCIKWLNHALPYKNSIQKTLKVLVFVLSTLALVI